VAKAFPHVKPVDHGLAVGNRIMRGAVMICALVAAAGAQPLTQRPLAISGVTVIDPDGGSAVAGIQCVSRPLARWG